MSTNTTPPVVLADEPETTVPARRSLMERGMVTAEYVVGIIAAIALALVLLKVFNADGIFKMIDRVVTGIFETIFGFFS